MRSQTFTVSTYLILATLLALPIMLTVYKPARTLVRFMAPVTCISDSLCIDDMSRWSEAVDLLESAESFVNASVGQMKSPPHVIFCSTNTCARYFGLTKAAGLTVGTWGIVINPTGWNSYTVRHEMIHHLQNERIGTLKNMISTPTWLFEGMAISLSQDPRRVFEDNNLSPEYRTKFNDWYATIDHRQLWPEIARQF